MGIELNRCNTCKIKICTENCTKNLGGQQSIEIFHFMFTMLGVIVIRNFFLTKIVFANYIRLILSKFTS